MNRSPIAATIVVAVFVVGVPVALVRRLTDGLLPTQAYDIVLAMAVVAWIFVAKAILDRSAPLSTLVENRLSPSRQAQSLVEQSLLGVGFTGRSAAIEPSARIRALQSAVEPIDALLPPDMDPSSSGRIHGEIDEEGPARLLPTLRRYEPVDPPFFETEEYVVQRGDTFWSIAEERLGDGRHWRSIEDVNLGREIAPGVALRAGDTLRIGWSVLIPRVEESAQRS